MNKTVTKSNPVLTENLQARMRRIMAEKPSLKLNQSIIARAIECSQASVSLALSAPHRVPETVKLVKEYFDLLESQKQGTKSDTAVA